MQDYKNGKRATAYLINFHNYGIVSVGKEIKVHEHREVPEVTFWNFFFCKNSSRGHCSGADRLVVFVIAV